MSAHESGHAKNVASFENLISYCTSYGTTYNPAKASIKLTALQTNLSNARTALSQVNAALTTHNNAINARMIAFANIKKLSTRLVNALIASGASDETIKDTKSINRKIQGGRAKSVLVEAENVPVNGSTERSAGSIPFPERPKTISVSQQSFNYLVEHFAKMVSLLSAEPVYIPNESELKVTALNAYLSNLRANNTTVVMAHTSLSNARISRNAILYHIVTGLCRNAKEAKLYIKSVFGATSAQFKQVSALEFVTRKL
jgi:hypothetical protein